MKIKKEYIILAVIIIALSVYLFMRRDDRTLYELPEVPQVSQKDITRLQISKNNTIIDLKKKDDSWFIAPQEYPTDAAKVKNMLDTIEKFTLTALVSESKNYTLYDLSDKAKINVKAWQGDSLKRDIDVGKSASSFRHTFVKTAGDDRVFHARGNFRDTFDTTVDDLRDKIILTYTPADIQEIKVTQGQESFILNRSQLPEKEESPTADKKENAPPPTPKTVWQTPDGRTGDDAALNRLLNRLSNLRCQTFIEDRGKEDFTSPVITIELKGTQEYSLSVFAKTEEKDTEQPAVSSANKYAFLLAGSQVEGIVKDASDIFKKPETAETSSEPEPEKAEKD
ncbi:MAG: DUF4340 domain-containing protein [Desulfobacterales bacterium]